ncbi:MerR family transcriptional regulator [Desulfobacterales bacterium HSG16]|nr:MerR family transcriptional regulator [Desulfobacterales bacterium HSG16]
MEGKTYSISKLASELDISPRTIRFYEEKHLISPERTEKKQRIYSQKDRTRLKMILRGKRFGFTLHEIAGIIGMADADINEVEQIEKSLALGKIKLDEIRQRKQDLTLLEQDILSMKDRLESCLVNLQDKEKGER